MGLLNKELGDITLEGVKKEVGEEMSRKYGGELYGVLCGLTTGEANVVVRGVTDKFKEQCGFVAVKVLSDRFNPKTPARLLQYLSALIKPVQVRDIRQVAKAVEELDMKINKLRGEWVMQWDDRLSVAILLNMLPKDMHDVVFSMGGKAEDMVYKEVRDKVVAVAGNRSQLLAPTPMDVGNVG